MVHDQILTVEQAAERLQAHPQTVRKWLREGKLRGVMPGGKKLGYRIRASEVDRLLNPDAASSSTS
jgi:excisionase family DNA binding protein